MNFKRIFTSLVPIAVVVAIMGGVQTVSAQRWNDEYRDYVRAQREAQEEYREYLRTRSRGDYRDWQRARREAQREYAEYRRTAGYNNRYYNRRGNVYRVYRGGNYYNVDQRGYQLLREAINRGYQQGYNAGVRDRRYAYGDNYYYNDRVYRAGSYGYQSYVTRDQYQYYFQQGFERGYRDGYNSTYQYGYRTNNGLNVLGNVISSILQIVDQ